MKTLAFAMLVLVLTLPLHADNWLDNGDFSDGIDHWRGNGRSPSDFAPDNPFDKPDPFTAKGLILELRGADWDKIQQDFHGKSTSGVLTVTYMVSPDLAFSDKPEDYANIPDLIHYDGWKPFSIPQGNLIVIIADFGTARGTYYPIKPKLGSSEPQTFRAEVHGLTPLEDKTITIACPPGSGKLVILSVSMTDN
jgi:hypothetical protein